MWKSQLLYDYKSLTLDNFVSIRLKVLRCPHSLKLAKQIHDLYYPLYSSKLENKMPYIELGQFNQVKNIARVLINVHREDSHPGNSIGFTRVDDIGQTIAASAVVPEQLLEVVM